MNRKRLSVFEKHRLKIAKKTIKMNDVMARIMGGMTKKEAESFIKRLEELYPDED